MKLTKKVSTQFHTHVNVFAGQEQVESVLKEIGLRASNARRFDYDQVREFGLHTHRTDNRAHAESIWENVCRTLTDITGVEGYLEKEILILPISEGNLDISLHQKPVCILHTDGRKKRADVHIKRAQKRDELDEALLSSGFYEVEIHGNPSRRIFTMQTTTVAEARAIANYWQEHTKGKRDVVSYEIVQEIINIGKKINYVKAVYAATMITAL